MKAYFSVALLALLLIRGAWSQDPVKVTVYYRSIEPDSVEFITQQLHPTYLELNKRDVDYYRDRMVVALVPYEDADDEASLMANCKARALSCLVSKIHACANVAVSKYSDDWKTLNYVNCLLLTAHTASKHCANVTCNDNYAMPQCVNTVIGDQLIMVNSAKTKSLNISLTSFPVVTFNGVYEEGEQAAARSNLLAALCGKFPRLLEGFCDDQRANKTMTHKNFATEYYFPADWRCEY